MLNFTHMGRMFQLLSLSDRKKIKIVLNGRGYADTPNDFVLN